MIFDLDLIKKVYSGMPAKIKTARSLTGKPLTLAEKILYTHLYQNPSKPYERGKDYVDFAPDRVAMQDATAQMALLQFMTCGRATVAVPSTVHCDHLIKAKTGAVADWQQPSTSTKYTIYWHPFQINMVLASGNPGPVSFTRLFWKIMLSPAV
jgi:aconitate hydratase